MSEEAERASENHNRAVMLQRVKSVWLQGVLEESLHGAALIDLGMAYRPSAVANDLYPDWQQTADYDQPVPASQTIRQVFDDAGAALLIVGEPGAGKTTTLLQLVDSLMFDAQQDEQRPVPVVLSLAAWRREQTLGQWMVDELRHDYEVPRALGQRWLQQGRLMPLLDGLDELDPDYQETCAQAINHFRRRYPHLPIVVSSRSQDYQAFPTRLELAQAVVLQPLNEAQIDHYLGSLGERLAGLRAALRQDATLRELARSPLMLSIMTLAYYRLPADAAIALGDPDTGRRLLFEVYVERMTRYRGGADQYDPGRAVRWLSWLARLLWRHNLPVFFLEGLQPDALTEKRQRQYRLGVKGITALLLALPWLLTGLIALAYGSFHGLAIGLALALLAGGLPLLTGRLLTRAPALWQQIETVESVGWSWPWAWLSPALGALAGLILALLVAAAGGRAGVPWLWLLPVFFGASQVLEQAPQRQDIRLRTFPGQGVARSRQNGLRLGIGGALGTALLFALALAGAGLAGAAWSWVATLAWVIGAALYLGVSAGLIYGGLAALKHALLLALLRQDNLAAPHPIHFLDYASERSLLRKVGGGYGFVHALLLDYFRTLGT